MPTLGIRPGLHIHIHTLPGSSYIKWRLPEPPPATFNPEDSSFHPYVETPPFKELLSSISSDDLILIKRRLLQDHEDRRNLFRKANAVIPMKTLDPAYLSTVFEYVPTGKPADFWVVTACNPHGKPADPGDNLVADARLLADIEVLKITPFRVTGLSPDETHAEPGWGLPCDEETAIALGRSHRQQAVWHFSGGRIDLVNCRTRKRHPLEDPELRIRDPRDLRHFTLFVGSPVGRNRLDPLEYAGVCTRVGALFPGFTVQQTEGCFRSRFEDTLLIHIATREPLKVINAAHEIRCFLNQDGIGISHNGIYQRVRDWSDTKVILESFGLNHEPAMP